MRTAHVTRDGRIICSVPGCGFFIGVFFEQRWLDGKTERMLATNRHLLLDHERGVWRPGTRYKRYGATARRDPKEFQRIDSRMCRLDGQPPFRAELRPEEEVVIGGIPLPATVVCPNGHQSVLDPQQLGLTAWIGHDGTLIQIR
jgi:hypothetical protein